MATKKYIVRDGFHAAIAISKADGSTSEKRYDGGEEVSLDDATAALHLHKLEFADQRDRDAQEKADRAKAVASAKAQHPVELVSMLAEALNAQIAAASVGAPKA